MPPLPKTESQIREHIDQAFFWMQREACTEAQVEEKLRTLGLQPVEIMEVMEGLKKKTHLHYRNDGRKKLMIGLGLLSVAFLLPFLSFPLGIKGDSVIYLAGAIGAIGLLIIITRKIR